jgi:hypothetical protein
MNLIPFTNLCFIFSLRPINLHQLSTQKNAEICLSLVLGRFWPCLPRKSSNLFSLLLSQPSHSFTSFLHLSLSFQSRGGSSFYTTLPSPPSPLPSPSLHNPPHHPKVFPTHEKALFLSINPKQLKSTQFSPSSLSLSHLREGLLSLYQSKNS